MSIWEVLISGGISLFAGALGGILTAGVITRRSESAKTRYRAESALYETLRDYRDHLLHEHRQNGICKEGLGAASLKGREQLATSVLRQLPSLKKTAHKRLREDLTELVGSDTMDIGARRVNIREHEIDRVADERRREVVKHQLDTESRVTDGHYVLAVKHGLLGIVYASPNDVKHHQSYVDQAIARLDAMIKHVHP